MNHSLKTRVISLFLAVVMVFGMLPMAAFATEDQQETKPTETTAPVVSEETPPAVDAVNIVYVTVSFDAQGGTEIASQTIASGSKVVKPEDPTYEGHIFLGWYNGETAWNFESDVVSSDLTLTAVWQENKPEIVEYTVSFDAQGGTEIASQTIASGSKVVKPEDPTYEGHAFLGWYNGETAWNFESDVVSSDLTLTAVWQENKPEVVEYTVSFEAQGGTDIASQTIASGSKAVKPEDPTYEGHIFLGWYNGETAWNFESDVVSSDLTLTAVWQENKPEVVEYTVSFDAQGGTEIASQTIASGSKVVKPEDPTYEGHTFQGWYVGEEAWNFETPVTTDITLTAVWTEAAVADIPVYTVTFNANKGSGTMEAQTVSGTAALNKNTFTYVDHQFLGWNTAENGYGTSYADGAEVTLTEDITLYAQWKDTYYSIVEEKNWTIAPGITETELVLNNAAGNQRQVLHIMEADMNNPYTKVTTSYTNMDTSNYAVSNMLVQANWVRDNWGWNVVGAMNSCLSWYNSAAYAQDPSRVNEPLGFMMIDGKVYFDHSVGFPTVLVIHKDTNDAGERRPADIPKVQMRTVNNSGDLNGWEEQVIPTSSGFIVENGKNKYTPSHTGGAPRSVVGIKPDGTVVIMMNDGRQDPYSIGMNMYELAEVMLSLGCSYAVNCDGGGSSTFLSQRPGTTGLAVNCSPSDGALRENTSGVLIISTAPADGAFNSAYISSDYDHYTPNSKVTLNVAGLDFSGAAAEIPADAVWTLSDDSYGTVSDGVFTSNGKIGTVDVQMVYNEKVVGSKTLTIVNPDNIAFAQGSTVIPYGKTIPMDIEATYGVFEVGFDADSFEWTLSNENAGVLNGLEFTACDDLSIGSVVITAVYKYAEMDDLVLNVSFGKGSEVVWDFEDGDVSNWMGQEQVRQWLAENNIAESELFPGVNYSEDNSTRTFLSSRENGGQVKNGEYALGLEVDYRYSRFSEWSYTVLFNVEGETVLRDVANGKNATKLGMWVYIPEGLVVGKDLKGLAMQYQLYGGTSADDVGSFGGHLLTAEGKNLASLTDADIPEDRWIYFYIDLSSKNYVALQNPEKQTWREPSFIRFYTQHYTPKNMVFYFDDLTLDYSDAVDDRDAPVISNLVIDIEGNNRRTFNATIADYAASNTSGLNYSSAKIYIDGIAMHGVTASGNRISGDAVEIPCGTHTVTFEISDNMGNTTKKSQNFTVAGTAPVTLGGHNDLNNKPEYDSVYYVDINVADITKIDSISAVLDLNTAHLWETAGMTAAEGFTATASVNKYANTVTVTVTRTGDCSLTGAQTLLSIPTRIYSWRDTSIYSAAEIFETGLCPVVPYDAKVVKGGVTFAEGAYNGYEGVFGGSISVTTNLDDNKIEWHTHTVSELEDKVATCGEAGYTDRTYCHKCGSVMAWGTAVPATGHIYTVDETDGKAKCGCGALLTGTLDGIAYVEGVLLNGWVDNTYYMAGVKVTGVQKVAAPDSSDEFYYDFGENGECVEQKKYTGMFQDGELYRYSYLGILTSGWQMVENEWYYFSASTMAAVSGTVKIGGVRFNFEENGKLSSGVWVSTLKGTRYYYGPAYHIKEWQQINGEWYYFENGYRLEGVRQVKARGDVMARKWYDFGQDGICRDIPDGFVEVDGTLRYLVNGVPRTGLWKIDDEYYYFDYLGRAVKGSAFVSETHCDLNADTYYFGTDYKMANGLVETDDGVYYYTNGKVGQTVGLTKIGEDYYFVAYSGKCVTGEYFAWQTNCELKTDTYRFGADGKMLQGIVEIDGNIYYYKNGKPGGNSVGLTKIGDDYYFIHYSGKCQTGKYFAWQTNCDLKCDNYEFGADGKLLTQIVEKEDGYYYYEAGKVGKTVGLTKVGEDYYFVNYSGKVSTGKLFAWATNCDLKTDTYEFGADGKMLQGIVEKEDGVYYYTTGQVGKIAGLIQVGEDYYFVNYSGKVSTGKLFAWATNCDLKTDTYEFGADGKMLQGIVEKEDGVYYYTNGQVGKTVGLTQVDEDYYFVSYTGKCITGEYFAWATNCDLKTDTYEFGADGKMLNGIVEKTDGIYYYVNGQTGKTVGLTKIDNDYYFINASGKVSTGKLFAWQTNCELKCDTYEFGSDGKMLNGFVTKNDGIYYYIDGKAAPVGLNYADGYYYFVNYSGKLVTNQTFYVWEGNGLLLETNYTFDELGRIIK